MRLTPGKFFTGFLLAGNLYAGAPPQVWLTPNAGVAGQLIERPWPADTGNRITGLKFYVSWLGRTPTNELARLARLVEDRKLQVAVEVAGLQTPNWGDKIGEKTAQGELAALRGWRAVGGRVDVLELDGPERRAMGLDFPPGSVITNHITDVKVIARQISEYMALMRTEFPSVRFHLLVNFPNWGWKGGPDFLARGPARNNWGDYHTILNGILAVVQTNDARFVGLTVDSPYGYTIGRYPPGAKPPVTGVDWVARMADLFAVARQHKLACGLILNCETGGNTSDELFARETLAFTQLVRQRKLACDFVHVQSWYEFPKTVVGDKLPAQLKLADEVAGILEKQ
jgi:hypothetical protein